MGKANQIVAIEKGIKSRVHSVVSELYKVVQKPDLFNGFVKTYEKKNEDSEQLPPEKKRVQFVAEDVLQQARNAFTELFNVTARKDWTNCEATADLKVDGMTLVSKAPVTFLLFLEKQLTDIKTFITNLPLLDDAEDWELDSNSGFFKTAANDTHRTKKVQKPIVLYPATDKHQAQTQLITEDEIVGYYKTIKQSGAMPKNRKVELLTRIEKLLQATKEAREEANNCEEVNSPNVGEALFGYLLG